MSAGDEHMGTFVYCTQHVRPHTTGWCHVAAEDKIRLAAAGWMESDNECRRIGLDIVGTLLNRSAADRERHRLMMPLAVACQQRHYRSWLTPQPHRGERDRILRRLAEIRGAS